MMSRKSAYRVAGGATLLAGLHMTQQSGAQASAPEPGALVEVSMRSRVGVVLDEIPQPLRAAATAYYLAQPASFWRARAVAQLQHTGYRLTYRNFFYDSGDKGMLALPPRELWQIDLRSPGARRMRVDGHDAIVIGYSLRTTLLSDAASPGLAEPALARNGGTWREPFNLPLDPEFLFQRTGYACMDEAGYPLRTADSENAFQLFDQTCEVETPEQASCHLTVFPQESCQQALRRHVGRVDTFLKLRRVPYDKRKADAVRIEQYTSMRGPDLSVVSEGLDNNRIVYRYIEPDSCALQEQCVSGSGWRRLLLYDASIKNSSPLPLTIGEVSQASPFVQHNVFEFSACHQHYHYSHYGDFRYGALAGDKRAFCIESTDRYFNSEHTPLVHPYSCDNQGVASGWGDTYIAGVECNWIDITDLSVPARGTTQPLEFVLNPDDFICEGTPVTGAQGEQLFTPTAEVGENGEPIDRPLCEFVPGHQSNNVARRNVNVPHDGGFITAPCTRGQAGPLKDCGFEEQAEDRHCTPGSEVSLSCSLRQGAPAQALRVCENSQALGGVTACMYEQALANTIVVSSEPTPVSFVCPTARDTGEPGGSYGYFTSALLPNYAPADVECVVMR